MTDKEKLKIAVAALNKIKNNFPNPSTPSEMVAEFALSKIQSKPEYEIVGKCSDGIIRNIFKNDKTYVRKSMAERMRDQMQVITEEKLFVREVGEGDIK